MNYIIVRRELQDSPEKLVKTQRLFSFHNKLFTFSQKNIY